jgi:hypothetical protein
MEIEFAHEPMVIRLSGHQEPAPNCRAVIPAGPDEAGALLRNAIDLLEPEARDQIPDFRRNSEQEPGGRRVAPRA